MELRKAIEAIAYERLQDYISDIPPRRLVEWQAWKVLDAVLSIDPDTAYIRQLSVQMEDEQGEPVWIVLGKDESLNMRSLKNNYSALGNYLHTPTIAQIETGKDFNADKAKKKCEAILSEVESVLNIENWTFTLSVPFEFECMRHGCGALLKRRMNALVGPSERSDSTLVVECFECEAAYEVTKSGPKEISIKAKVSKVVCRQSDCGNTLQIWHADVRVGNTITCGRCGVTSDVVLGIAPSSTE